MNFKGAHKARRYRGFAVMTEIQSNPHVVHQGCSAFTPASNEHGNAVKQCMFRYA